MTLGPDMVRSNLPVIDLEPWFRGDRGRTAWALRSACLKTGFFFVSNHRLPDGLLDRIRAASRSFFSLPLEEKLRIHFEKARKQRGYIPLRGESSDPKGKGDEKEALDFTFPVLPEGVSDPVAYRMYGPNLWPEGLSGFRETVESYFEEMIRIAGTLFEILAASLELPHDFFRPRIDRPIAQLRLLHYPPQSEPLDEASLGIGEHCDYECFTILDPGDVTGLQLRDQKGEWLEVQPLPGAFVVNLGEMLARWTNDVYRATVHRVVNRSSRERYAIPFFFGTNYDTLIECLPTCSGPERPSRYPPILAGEYLAKRLNEVYGSLPNS
ncbi:MAG TPA: 2-oxoglutarate and iron-dependent oxygenase domain-containing protein [Vicinamibacteria bacterium]|nr:2-oxoglutarate and iron-dependent oxygenase domain-containing protein [Vicinamibacteria bacterium]